LNDVVGAPGIAILLFALMLVCVELGYRLAMARRGKEADETFSVVEGAAYSLVGLLLGFSFSLAVSHYDARRLLVVKEANAIGTTMLRSQMLPVAEAAEMRAALRDYIDARLAFALSDRDQEAQARASARSARLQDRMWAVARTQAAHDPRSSVTLLFVTTLNETIDASGEQSAALNANIPTPVIVVLVIVILVGAVLLGYGFGKSGRHFVATVLFSAMLAIVVAIILDLDRAQAGTIRVSLEPFRQLQAQIASSAP